MPPEPKNQETADITVEPGATGPVLTQAQKRFYASEQCTELRQALQTLVDSHEFNTDAGKSRGDTQGFVERHLRYLSNHPHVSVEGYISNLRLMTRNARR